MGTVVRIETFDLLSTCHFFLFVKPNSPFSLEKLIIKCICQPHKSTLKVSGVTAIGLGYNPKLAVNIVYCTSLLSFHCK